MEIFEISDYRQIIRHRIAEMPKKGFGSLRQLAQAIGINSVVMSQILHGKRNLNLEQALDVCRFFNFTRLEQDYFQLTVQLERAGTQRLKKYILEKIGELKNQSQNLKDRLSQSTSISLEAQAEYYSNWLYSAVRIASSLQNGLTIEQIADAVGVSTAEVQLCMEFLLKHGLCELRDNRFTTGAGITHLEAVSPLVKSHHKNWRIKSLELMTRPDPGNLFYTLPIALSEADRKTVRKKLLHLIEELNELLKPSPSEQLACLNIDWFGFKKNS